MGQSSSDDNAQPTPVSRVFCSYSSADRSRVAGLGLLLEALGHSVFLDHKTIKPGAKWQASLQEGLDHADALLVYWTASAARSEWVRKEIEYFHGHYPTRMLVPILGDETPLTELLKCHQTSDFAPLINELLALKRRMAQDNAKPAQIEEALLKRLNAAGIHLNNRQRKKLLRLFALTGFSGLLVAPALTLSDFASRAVETVAQISLPQLIALGVAMVSGIVICQSTDDTQITATQSTYSRPGDVWLGMWSVFREDTSTAYDTLLIQRDCNDYKIMAKGVSGENIHHISEQRFHFTEGGTQYDATITAKGYATVTTTSPSPGDASRIHFKKVPNFPVTITECAD